jgi:periplasmic copper chaperone A
MKRMMMLAALLLPTALIAHDYTVGGLQIIHPAAGARRPRRRPVRDISRS